MNLLDQIKNAVYEGLEDETSAMVQAAVDKGTSPQAILDTMMEAMEMVGEEFKKRGALYTGGAVLMLRHAERVRGAEASAFRKPADRYWNHCAGKRKGRHARYLAKTW